MLMIVSRNRDDGNCIVVSDALRHSGDLRSRRPNNLRTRFANLGLVDLTKRAPNPSPMHYDYLFFKVDAQKRVDALEKHSLGALLIPRGPGLKHDVPISPTAVLELLARSGVSVRGRRVTVVGYGRLVGAPLVQLLLQKGATVSICRYLIVVWCLA